MIDFFKIVTFEKLHLLPEARNVEQNQNKITGFCLLTFLTTPLLTMKYNMPIFYCYGWSTRNRYSTILILF